MHKFQKRKNSAYLKYYNSVFKVSLHSKACSLKIILTHFVNKPLHYKQTKCNITLQWNNSSLKITDICIYSQRVRNTEKQKKMFTDFFQRREVNTWYEQQWSHRHEWFNTCKHSFNLILTQSHTLGTTSLSRQFWYALEVNIIFFLYYLFFRII